MFPATTLQELADLLARGGVIAYPTETFYGLGCDPGNAEAVRRIFTLKGRPEGKPLPILLPEGDPERFGFRMTPIARRLSAAWPAPLSLIVPAEGYPDEVTAGTGTLAVRRSPHPFVAALMEHWKRPLVSTSANLTGEPATTRGADVFRAFGTRLACLVDGGDLPGRLGSTIVDCTGADPVVVRAGDYPFP